MNAMVDWLTGIAKNEVPGPHSLTDILPLRVKIGKSTYTGASYLQNGREHVALMGPLPASYVRSTRTAYRFPGDDHDWYVSHWHEGVRVFRFDRWIDPPSCGEYFGLAQWDLPSSIDEVFVRKYKRIDVKVIE